MRIVLQLLLISFLFMQFCYADTNNYPQQAGTPKGFYDEIDPDSIDEEEEQYNINSKSNDNSNSPYKHFSQNNETKNQSVEVKPTKDYAKIYNSLEPASHSYLHGIDPDEYYDSQNAAWSIYPLLRLNSPIYFKNQTIEPGYYLLTPREHKNKWYILLKQNGKVVHIIPVYERAFL